MTITIGGKKIQNNARINLASDKIIEYMKHDIVDENDITAYCDWHGANYYPTEIEIEDAPSEIILESSRQKTREINTVCGKVILTNLLLDTDYRITAGDEVFCFSTTAEAPRTVRIPNVNNSRDLGYKVTPDGKKRLRQGIIYRGNTAKNAGADAWKMMRDSLGIKTDIDLTGGGETLPEMLTYMNLVQHSIKWYQHVFVDEESMPVLRDAILEFTDKSKYPFYVHCSLGRDRTGTLIFFLMMICGFTWQDFVHEHILSFFSTIGDGENAGLPAHLGNINVMRSYCMNTLGKNYSLNENALAYLKKIGLTENDFEKIRENMLESI